MDDPSLTERNIVAVTSRDNTTELGPLDHAGRYALREELYTAGELLRANQLVPDEKV